MCLLIAAAWRGLIAGRRRRTPAIKAIGRVLRETDGGASRPGRPPLREPMGVTVSAGGCGVPAWLVTGRTCN